MYNKSPTAMKRLTKSPIILVVFLFSCSTVVSYAQSRDTRAKSSTYVDPSFKIKKKKNVEQHTAKNNKRLNQNIKKHKKRNAHHTSKDVNTRENGRYQLDKHKTRTKSKKDGSMKIKHTKIYRYQH